MKHTQEVTDSSFSDPNKGESNRARSGGGGLRTRGVVRTRGFAQTPEIPVRESSTRSRGAVRTRGGVPKESETPPAWKKLATADLPAVFTHLRNRQDGFPLTIVVENPRQQKAEEFLKQIGNLLGTKDALWLLDNEVGGRADSAYLNLNNPADEAFARSLVADLLFMVDSGGEALKDRFKKWARRACAVIVARPDNESTLKSGSVGLPGLRYVWPS